MPRVARFRVQGTTLLVEGKITEAVQTLTSAVAAMHGISGMQVGTCPCIESPQTANLSLSLLQDISPAWLHFNRGERLCIGSHPQFLFLIPRRGQALR
jgi:hypothetical protein